MVVHQKRTYVSSRLFTTANTRRKLIALRRGTVGAMYGATSQRVESVPGGRPSQQYCFIAMRCKILTANLAVRSVVLVCICFCFG